MQRTHDKTFHLVFSLYLYAQRLSYLVVIFEGAAAGRHDAQLAEASAVELLLLRLQPVHEGNALVEVLRLEFDEVEASAQLGAARLRGEVDEFGEGAADLFEGCQSCPQARS